MLPDRVVLTGTWLWPGCGAVKSFIHDCAIDWNGGNPTFVAMTLIAHLFLIIMLWVIEACMNDSDLSLSKKRILVVEDDSLIAMLVEDLLEHHGYEVVGPAFSVKEGVRFGQDEVIDGAVLDVNIAGEMVFPVADILAERAVPFVFVTGYGPSLLREKDKSCPVLQKPYTDTMLLHIVRQWPQGSGAH